APVRRASDPHPGHVSGEPSKGRASEAGWRIPIPLRPVSDEWHVGTAPILPRTGSPYSIFSKDGSEDDPMAGAAGPQSGAGSADSRQSIFSNHGNEDDPMAGADSGSDSGREDHLGFGPPDHKMQSPSGREGERDVATAASQRLESDD